jgi:hypothetical protein
MDTSVSPVNLPLHDIHLPAAISWWPPAPGWWLTLGVVLFLALGGFLLWRHTVRRRYRRLALRALSALEQQHLQDQDHMQLVAALSRLLRQAALLHFPSAYCAGLVGNDWLTFLDQNPGKVSFSEGAGQILATGPYLNRSPEVDAAALLAVCRSWLRSLPPIPKSSRRRI